MTRARAHHVRLDVLFPLPVSRLLRPFHRRHLITCPERENTLGSVIDLLRGGVDRQM